MAEIAVWKILETAAPGLSAGLRESILKSAFKVRVTSGGTIFAPGDACENFLIALSGTVRVEHMGETGRSVVLYRVSPGGTCVMTTSCLLTGAQYQAYGTAEGNVEALALPRPVFRQLIAENDEFRSLAFSAFARRVIDLVQVVDELLLHRVDGKLAAWISQRDDDLVKMTHQQIATEIGTVREVVSRTLKEFEHRGWIEQARGKFRITDRAALSRGTHPAR